jgi:hypothetical protein
VYKLASDPEHDYNFDVENVKNPLTQARVSGFFFFLKLIIVPRYRYQNRTRADITKI